MNCNCADNSICPCEQFVHPAPISNVASLDHISYRIGDYTTFREALLRALPGEASLSSGTIDGAKGSATSPGGGNVARMWRPGAGGDLAVQMIEWWAYLADILTFYNERIASQAYLRTADQAITVNRLVRLLGYRPRPGIGATGTLAALMKGTTPFTLPQGFQIQSKPGPGEQPQIFELETQTTVGLPSLTTVYPEPVFGIKMGVDSNNLPTLTIFATGVLSSVKQFDEFLVRSTPDISPVEYFFGTVQAVAPCKDTSGNTYTKLVLSQKTTSASINAPFGVQNSASNYQLLRTTQFMRLSSSSPLTLPTGILQGTTINLESIARQIVYEDIVVFEDGTNAPLVAFVKSASDVIDYTTIPSSPPTTVPLPETQLVVLGPDFSNFQTATGVAKFNWRTVGQLMDQPVVDVTVGSPSSPSSTSDQWVLGSKPGDLTLDLNATRQAAFPAASDSPAVLLDDANGLGTIGNLSLSTSPETTATLTVSSPNTPPATLTTPLRVLYNLLPVSRGKTVPSEVLGNGNAAIAGQDFTLQKSPVTYLQNSSSLSGPLYSSTVRVWVNQVEWAEVQSFFGQKADAQVFITREDEQSQTHVVFGDGVNGARPPTGINNIVANYRYGSGAMVPDVGSLTMILKPQPGLKAVVNPVPMSGGADADPRDQVRQYAPRSVLTFNRAVSLDDFQAIAATTPGVSRAQAAITVNPDSQQPEIQIYVLPGGAATGVQTGLQGIADPSCVFSVLPATPIYASISATLVIDPKMNPDLVLANATNSLAGQNSGLFVLDPNSTPGVYILDIGQSVYDSQIFEALQVPGVLAVVDYSFGFSTLASGPSTPCTLQRHDPQAGNYFALLLANLDLTYPQPAPSS
jgi:hypothetical protein